MKPYPLLFHPILKSRVWGGRLLESLGKVLPPLENIGESWEIADLPANIEGGRSVIANGELAGRTLREAINSHGPAIMGDARLTSDGGFPLLIKFLDAQQNLSVQVHPDKNYADKNPGSHLKSEAWVIVNAQPGAVIYNGVKEDVTAEKFIDDIRRGEVANDLTAVPARVGDCHYLPSGTCHALGAGVLVAEVQTPSDTTFRVYDWGRTDRELHIEQAMQCIKFGGHQSLSKPSREPIEVGGIRTRELCTSAYFSIEHVDAIQPSTFRVVTSGRPEVWMLLGGAGTVQGDHPTIPLAPGQTVLIPADLDKSSVSLERLAKLLRVKMPSPFEGKIA